MINDPLKYVAVPYAELQALLEMARNVSKNSPWGQSDTQPWNPEIKQLAELGDEVPTIAGIIGESNTVLISMPDFEAIKQLMPVVGANNNWWINGVDSGVSAIPDASRVLRPPMVIRFPSVLATENQDEVIVSGGVITVYNGVDRVVELVITDTVVNIYNKKMVVVDYQGIVTAVDTDYPIVTAVPLFYTAHIVHGLVDVSAAIVFAVSAPELSYYIQTIRELKLIDVDEIRNIIDTGVAAVSNLINTLEAEASAKLLGVPRVLSFCSFNDVEYVSGSTIAYFKTDHSFVFPSDFAGSQAAFILREPYTVNPEIALIGIFVNNKRIGSVQLGTDNVVVFIMYEEGYNIQIGDTLSFKVDALTYITSFTLTLVHTLGA